jgi:hypothetical protein
MVVLGALGAAAESAGSVCCGSAASAASVRAEAAVSFSPERRRERRRRFGRVRLLCSGSVSGPASCDGLARALSSPRSQSSSAGKLKAEVALGVSDVVAVGSPSAGAADDAVAGGAEAFAVAVGWCSVSGEASVGRRRRRRRRRFSLVCDAPPLWASDSVCDASALRAAVGCPPPWGAAGAASPAALRARRGLRRRRLGRSLASLCCRSFPSVVGAPVLGGAAPLPPDSLPAVARASSRDAPADAALCSPEAFEGAAPACFWADVSSSRLIDWFPLVGQRQGSRVSGRHWRCPRGRAGPFALPRAVEEVVCRKSVAHQGGRPHRLGRTPAADRRGRRMSRAGLAGGAE